jgi:hypothetical protein
LSGSFEPDFGFRPTIAQAHDSSVIVIIDLVVAGINIKRDELAIIFGTERRPHLTFENLLRQMSQLVWIATQWFCWHHMLQEAALCALSGNMAVMQ